MTSFKFTHTNYNSPSVGSAGTSDTSPSYPSQNEGIPGSRVMDQRVIRHIPCPFNFGSVCRWRWRRRYCSTNIVQFRLCQPAWTPRGFCQQRSSRLHPTQPAKHPKRRGCLRQHRATWQLCRHHAPTIVRQRHQQRLTHLPQPRSCPVGSHWYRSRHRCCQ
ncbi:hypothetical protein RvY_12643-2 [Ramazzottius varieornatus]|uniref:Uncharacterized protein n=1 Tax=Ramazzottius varieornatus TaxID=947166 RepID=A0A1D1VTX6_RAMVA|nr:hypothetical protein RvY_12643-2 [Ramazzottius varieornatus]